MTAWKKATHSGDGADMAEDGAAGSGGLVPWRPKLGSVSRRGRSTSHMVTEKYSLDSLTG